MTDTATSTHCDLCGGAPVVARAYERGDNPRQMPRQILVCEVCVRKVGAYERLTTEGTM